jgi:glutathione synthase/RimK-type ligase-like ATP-grasp enzyme
LSRKPFLCHFIDEIQDFSDQKPTDVRHFLTEKLKVFPSQKNPVDRRVLILTNRHDVEADLVGLGLLSKGIDYIRLNIEDIPSQLQIRYTLTHAFDLKTEFCIRQERWEPSDFNAVWLRHFDLQSINFGNDELVRKFSLQQWDNAYRSLQRNLTCKWISSPYATLQADDRIRQLSVAKSLGFDIPSTLVTNDPAAASTFYQSQDGDIVIKALHHHGIESDNKRYSIYTHTMKEVDLPLFNDLIYAPCILQERVHKKFEIRASVVGNKVFAAEIDSQSTLIGREDFHRCPLSELTIMPTSLDNAVTEQCIRMIDLMGLKCGAIDFVVNEDRSIIFLEVNAIGDWYWIERSAGLPITEAVVDLIFKQSNLPYSA